ncbi:MAG: efflux RND transporter periplasmic adaptor subunit [Rubrivivax sp.]
MKSKLTAGIALAGIAVVAVAAWWLQQPRAGSPAAAGGNVAAAGAGASGAARGADSGPVAVEVGVVQRMRLVDDTEAVGTLRSHQGVMLRPEVSGRIAAIGFRDGLAVRRGQMLVQLDDSLQRAQLRQAEAQAGIAQTQLQRNRELLTQGFISQSAVDQSAAALEVAQAQVALARAQQARMRIVAPFAGVAGIRLVSVGDYVKDGADLVNVEDTSKVWVDYRLPERFLARVRPGLVVDVRVDALPGQRFTGEIAALDSMVDANGRSLLVRARVDNRQGTLRPGMFARARTTLGVRDDALVVPEEALVPQAGKQYLIRVADGPRGPVSQRLEAELGSRIDGRVEVLSGLAEGDRVVTAGQARLMRGDALRLRIVQVGPAAAPASGAASAASTPAVGPAASAPAVRPSA